MDLSVQVIPARAAASFPLTSTKPPATLQHTEDQSEVFFAESCTLEVACPWELEPPRRSNPLGRLALHSLDRNAFRLRSRCQTVPGPASTLSLASARHRLHWLDVSDHSTGAPCSAQSRRPAPQARMVSCRVG